MTWKTGDIVINKNSGEVGVIKEVIFKIMRIIIEWDNGVYETYHFTSICHSKIPIGIHPYQTDFLERIKDRTK